MDFKHELKILVERIDGAQGAILVDSDGERIDSYAREGGLDLEWLGARYGITLRNALRIGGTLSDGELQELNLEQEKSSLLISPIYEGFFILLVMKPEGNPGQARFELRKAAFHIDRDLQGLSDVRMAGNRE